MRVRLFFAVSFSLAIVLSPCLYAGELSNTQKIASDALRVNEIRSRVAAENMANAKSPGYHPKNIQLRAEKKKFGKGPETVAVKRISKDATRVVMSYEPEHPQADANGYVALPEVNPMIELMNMQESRHSSERFLKIHEATTDTKHKLIGMMAR